MAIYNQQNAYFFASPDRISSPHDKLPNRHAGPYLHLSHRYNRLDAVLLSPIS